MKDYNYATLAEYYDELDIVNEKNNEVIDKLLKKYKVKTVLDMTCGTGVQVEYLLKKGYKVTASDLTKEMLDIAKKKFPNIEFHQGDMRTAKYGEFDAVITIFCAIGHLTKEDFEKAIKNISNNLNKNGIYIFDIFNMDFMKKNFVNHEFIDVAKEVKDMKIVRFNDNKLDIEKEIMHIDQKILLQKGMNKIKTIKEEWDMKIYSSKELKEILERNSYEVLEFLDMEGNQFDKDKSTSILCVARLK